VEVFLMFGFLTRRRTRKTATARPPYRPGLEGLERRDCPTGPAFTSLTATALPNKQALVSGTLTDPKPASVYITFDGVVQGSAQADANGAFSYTGPASGLGTITADGFDADNEELPSAQTQLTKSAPTVTLLVSNTMQRTVVLTGQVIDLDGGLTVTFSGVASGSVVTSSNGSYTLTTTASALGNIQAGVTDLWGQAATPAVAAVTSNAPVISNFTAIQGVAGYWTFSGKVMDESAAGLTVHLSGLSDLNEDVTVQADGTFTCTVRLASGDAGTVSAQTSDWWGLASNTAGVYVQQTEAGTRGT
jgi:hypothetical protein